MNQKKKICLIGGSGFVGSRFIADFKTKYDITILDKELSKDYPEICRICDIRDYDTLVKNLSDVDWVILLAAEHRDDVTPTNLYYDVNVEGTKNVIRAMDNLNIGNLIFTSSVAIYGLGNENPNENSPQKPFNDYGKSKMLAEEVLVHWFKDKLNNTEKNVTIIRPTVIFGEKNRGNVYNLFNTIFSRKFIMIGNGKNRKSICYVGNISMFLDYMINYDSHGLNIYNFADKPDLSINQLVQEVQLNLKRKKSSAIRIPRTIGLIIGRCFDFMRIITGKKYAISHVRIKKFCANSIYDSTKSHEIGFKPKYTLKEAIKSTVEYEFLRP